MSFRQVAFCVGCVAAWFILLPVFVVGGGVTLAAYAVLGEVGEFLVGSGNRTETFDAREIARRVCLTPGGARHPFEL